MTKDVLLSMKGMQFALNENQSESENIEILTTAQYYNKGTHSYLIYEEILEGVTEAIQNRIKFSDSYIEVTKRGPINVNMIFESGKQHLANYHTPYGEIVIGINTKSVSVIEEENRIHLQADYALDLNYEFLSNCSIVMDITPKDELHLS